MYQQQMSVLSEKDLVYSILADEKRVVREYATAATESNCPVVRQMFTELLHDTLQIQTELYQFMSMHGWYNTSSVALRQEVQKQVQYYGQAQQQLEHLVQQSTMAVPPPYGQPLSMMHQPI